MILRPESVACHPRRGFPAGSTGSSMKELAAAEFLARSENRITLLRLIATEEHTRAELADETGVSQATLGRILEEFQDRSWIRHDGNKYVITPTGRLVSTGVDELLEALAADQTLREVVPYLPADAMSFDLRLLANAEITRPTRTRPSAPLQTLLRLMESTKRLWAVSHTLNEQSLATVHERVSDGSLQFDAVLAVDAYTALANDDTAWKQVIDLVDADQAALYVSHEPIPLALGLSEQLVNLLLRDNDGVVRASVETTDETVVEWGHKTLNEYREAATLLDREAAKKLPDGA